MRSLKIEFYFKVIIIKCKFNSQPHFLAKLNGNNQLKNWPRLEGQSKSLSSFFCWCHFSERSGTQTQSWNCFHVWCHKGRHAAAQQKPVAWNMGPSNPRGAARAGVCGDDHRVEINPSHFFPSPHLPQSPTVCARPSQCDISSQGSRKQFRTFFSSSSSFFSGWIKI